MLFGLPLEVVTMLGSSLFGGVMTMWSQAAKAKADQFDMLIRANSQGHKQTLEQLKADPGFSWGRKFIVVIIMLAAFGTLFLPTLLGVPQVIELTSSSEGLFGLVSNTVTEYHEVQGFVTPEWLRFSIFSIMGLYFGNSMVKK